MGRGGTYKGGVAVYDDPQELARAIRKARGPRSQKDIGEPIGRSAKTVMRWEAGKGLGDTPAKRKATAILVAEVTGKRALLGLGDAQAEDELSERVEALESEIQQMPLLRSDLEALRGEVESLRGELLEAQEAEGQQDGASAGRSAEPGLGGASG